MWLLAQGKTDKALRTLGKLRGWVADDKCSNEFQEMVVFTSNYDTSKSFLHTQSINIMYFHVIYLYAADDKTDFDDNSREFWRQLVQPNVLKPFRLLLIYFFFANLLSGVPYGPYLVRVFTTFGTDIDVNWTVVSNSR